MHHYDIERKPGIWVSLHRCIFVSTYSPVTCSPPPLGMIRALHLLPVPILLDPFS